MTERGDVAAAVADYQHLVEAAPDGVVVSCRGIIRYANGAAARLLGFEEGPELVGHSFAEFLTPEALSVMRERVMAMQGGTRLAPHPYPAKRRDGVEVIAEIVSLPVTWNGEPAVIGFARDITERMRLEAKLARAERLASIGTLATGLAHEINNPLAFALLGLERLERLVAKRLGHLGMDDFREVMGDVRGGLERVAAIVNDLRAFARDGSASTGSASLRRVLGDVAKLVAHHIENRAHLHLEVGELPDVRGEALRLEQVFANLVINAVQAFSRSEGDNRITVSAHLADDGHVHVDVVDNGPGMAPEVLARAFDPFFTTKPGSGSGLGLWICHAIVTQLGGELTLESTLGSGTRAKLVLPRADVAGAIIDHVNPESSRSARRPSVLVVDDEPTLLRTVVALLTEEFAVEVASTGEAALERLFATPEPDVVLCDLSMPGVTGADLYERVASERPQLAPKIVFMTGGAFTEEARLFLERVPNARIEKPFSLATLRAALASATS